MAVDSPERARVQTRTVRVLMGSQVFGGMGLVAGYIPAALLAKEITGSATLAGIAAAMLSVGSSAAAFPLASYMYRKGRRPGLRAGYLVGGAGAIAAFNAAIFEIYPLLVLGVMLIGTGNAANLAARYAAADNAKPDRRASAISLIVWTTTIGSATGSFVALGGATRVADAIGLPELSGPYLLSIGVFAVASVIVHTFLRPDPLVVAGGLGKDDGGSRLEELVRSAKLIAANPNARIAVAAMITGQVVMVGVMTMTPLHMDDGGQGASVIGMMMSVHILGMYAFSPIIGWLSDRVGRLPMIAVGAGMLIAGAEFAARTSAEHAAGVTTGNFLIGLGWGFAVIAGSSLLTESFPIEQRVGVQGAADLVMSASGALAGLLSGSIVAMRSYPELGRYAVALSVILSAGVIWHRIRKTSTQETEAPPVAVG